MEDIRNLILRRRKFVQLIYRHFCIEKTKTETINEINDNYQTTLTPAEQELLTKWVYIIEEGIDFISKNLSSTWTWARLPKIHQAILINGYFEIVDEKREKAIVINEMLKFAVIYLPNQNNKYINAILDKL